MLDRHFRLFVLLLTATFLFAQRAGLQFGAIHWHPPNSHKLLFL